MDATLNDTLSKLSIAVRVANERHMCEVGLHAGQVQVLCSLWANDGQSQAGLVRALGVSAPTVNKMVSKLSAAGFVKIVRCPTDKRLMRVYLTDRGNDVRDNVKAQLESLENTILEGFTETERLLLPILLEKMLNNLQKQ